MVFNGRNILTGFPDKLVQVVGFLNEKAISGDFLFSDSLSYWEEHEDIIEPLKLKIDGNDLYYAVALAHIAHQTDGNILFTEDINVWGWGWSLNILADFAGWSPPFMKRVIKSFAGKMDDIDVLMNNAAHTYSRRRYDDGLTLMAELPQYRISIMAGLMENDYTRYCEQFPPKENQEEFTNASLQTYLLNQVEAEDVFDLTMQFDSFTTPVSMALLLKLHSNLCEEKKSICEKRVRDLLSSGCTKEYVNPITNWVSRLRESTHFMEDCIIATVSGLGKENHDCLNSIDNALVIHHVESQFLIKLIVCVAENLEPMDVLRMKRCLQNLSKSKEAFINMVLSFIMHPKGLFRLTGRKLWDNFHLENSDFKATDLEENLQCVFIVSMLQDYGNPETRLPKLLPLLIEGSEKVRSVLMRFIRPYLDDYMGHVINAIDDLKIECKETDTIKKYFERRSNAVKARRELKELSPVYTHEKVFRESVRLQNEHLQEQMKEAESNHKSSWKDLFASVLLARSGGWRDENGITRHLPLTTYSVPSRMMVESMSPKEQDEWWNQLLKDWDDTEGNY